MTRKLKKSYNYKVKTKEYIFKASNKWEQNKLWETKTFLCLSIKKRKKNYFENLDNNNISDSKTFWKTVEP